MLDWFASKVGMLVFVTVVLSVLMGFVLMESGAFALEQKTRMAEDVARIIDAAGGGGNITYEPPLAEYSLIIDSARKTVSVDGVTRHFLADASSTSLSSKAQLNIYNLGGTVYVQA